jgi:hypothetical protein
VLPRRLTLLPAIVLLVANGGCFNSGWTKNVEDPVYARYLTGGNARADPALAREIGSPSLRDRPFSTDFPSVLTLRLDHENGEFCLWFAQLLEKAEYPPSRLAALGERERRHSPCARQRPPPGRSRGGRRPAASVPWKPK